MPSLSLTRLLVCPVRTGSGPSALSGGYPSRGVPPAPASVGIPVGRGTTLYPHHTTSASGSTGIGIVFDDVSDTLTGPDGTSTPGDSFFTQQDYEADDALEPEQ